MDDHRFEGFRVPGETDDLVVPTLVVSLESGRGLDLERWQIIHAKDSGHEHMLAASSGFRSELRNLHAGVYPDAVGVVDLLPE